MLDTGVRRVVRLERQAIKALGTDGPGGACSTGPSFVAIASGGLLGLLGLGEAEVRSDGSAEGAQAQVAGQSDTSSESKSSGSPTVELPLGLPTTSVANLTWLFVIVLLVFFAAGVWRELLSSRRTAQHSREKWAGRTSRG